MEKTFEDFLMEIHAKQYTGTDDLMPDDFESWLQDKDTEDIIEYANQWGKKIRFEDSKHMAYSTLGALMFFTYRFKQELRNKILPPERILKLNQTIRDNEYQMKFLIEQLINAEKPIKILVTEPNKKSGIKNN